MSLVFADTFYWLALLNPRDDWHQNVLADARNNSDRSLVLTDGILDEVLNYASTRGSLMRQKALLLCSRLLQDPQITVVSYTPKLREAGLTLYGQRSDKAYSLTDCISMVVMKQMGITEVLTHDHHFTQEGFMILFSDWEGAVGRDRVCVSLELGDAIATSSSSTVKLTPNSLQR